MALTSVVSPFSENSSSTHHQLSEVGTLAATHFPAFTNINIPPSTHIGILATDAMNTGLLLNPTASSIAPSFIHNGILSPHITDPYQFGQPSGVCTAAYTHKSWLPDVNLTTCLLPTPNRNELDNNVEQNQNGSDRTSASDDGSCGRIVTTPSDSVVNSNHPLLLVVRLLMSGKEVGSIIGKRGENVKKYREESGAKINISDGASPERIVTVTGTSEQIFVAFTLMCQKFEDDFTQGLLRIGEEGMTCPPVTLRLLVPATQCGSIIGKGGGRIKDVRELTGASIQVASEALPASTERTVTISGTAKAIAKCVRHLCDIFIESPVKGPVILYRPRPAYTSPAVLCPGNAFTTQSSVVSTPVMHPGLVYTAAPTSDALSENGQAPSVSNTSMLPDTSISASINNAYLGTFPMNSDISSMGTISGLLSTTDGGQGMNSGCTSSIMTELIADNYSAQNGLPFPSFPACQWPLLNTTQISPALIPGNVLPSLSSAFVLPDINMNSALFYQANTLSPANNLFYTGITNPLFRTLDSKDCSPCQQSADNCSDMKDISQLASEGSPTNAMTVLPVLPQINGLKTNPIYCGAMPFLPNKASILSVPAFARTTGAANSLQLANNTPFSGLDGHVTKEMIISNDLIGCIIGRGGATVNEIRSISKAQVKISNCEEGAKERKITLSGSLQAVNLAHYLINNSIAAHQQAWAFSVSLASAVTALVTQSDTQLEQDHVRWETSEKRDGIDSSASHLKRTRLMEHVPANHAPIIPYKQSRKIEDDHYSKSPRMRLSPY